jgi:hypothetical protein
MSLKSLIYRIFNRLRGNVKTVNHGESCGYTVVNADLPSAVTRKCNRTRPTVDFNLPEALRLRDLGWGNRKIARQMNNISRETVRTRLREHDERHPKPPKPVQSSPLPDLKPPVASVPQSPVSSPAMRPPVPPIPPVVPPAKPPEPVSNYDGLVAYWALRGLPNVKINTRMFFLVHGAHNVVLGTGSEQLVVAIDQWHQEYHDLEEFQNVERIWVVLDPREDNRAFLLSIVADIWVREKCLVVVSSVLDICRYRLAWERDHHAGFMSSVYDAEFETACKFIPMPAPNYVREIEALLVPAPAPDVPQPVGGLYMPPSRTGQAAGDDIPAPKGDRSCGFAF